MSLNYFNFPSFWRILSPDSDCSVNGAFLLNLEKRHAIPSVVLRSQGRHCCEPIPCSPHMLAFLSSGFQASTFVFLLLNLILLHSSSSFSKCILLGVRSASRMCILVVSVIRFRVFSHYFFEITFVLVLLEVCCYPLL